MGTWSVGKCWEVEASTPGPVERERASLGAKNITPWDHECLIRDYVVGDKSTAEMAAEYGYAEQTIRAHRAEHQPEIAAVTAGMVDEFSHIWGRQTEKSCVGAD